MKKIFLFLILGLMTSFGLYAQTGSVSGKVKNGELGQLMEGVQVQLLGTNKLVYTNAEGEFQISEVPAGKHLIEVNHDGFESLSVAVSVTEGKNTSLGTLVLQVNSLLQSIEEIDVASIADQEVDVEAGDMYSSGLLNSRKDPFNAATAYTFSSARFRRKGYGSEETGLFFNGIPMNNMENGRAYWYLWGGLNDVTRNQTITDGLNPIANGFGGFGGSVNINTKASDYRKGTKVVYSASNRSYRNRLMITHSTGLMDNGWAFTASISKRWAKQGYIKGTSYDAYGYFLSALKKINDKHSIGLTVFGAPSERGGSGASTQAAYDIVGSNFYNPNWGWQDGKKRNAKMQKTHIPMAILKHYWDLNSKTKITTSVAFLKGRSGRTALNWIDAPDPRPDYYRNLPIYPSNEYNQEVAAHFKANSQINWDAMYRANQYNNPDYTKVIDGKTVNYGKAARYMVEDRRRDVEQIVADINVKHELNDNIELIGGANYNSYKARTYTVVDDLLGADFVWNLDKFATRQDPSIIYSADRRTERAQNDLDYFREHGEAEKLTKGDVYGHDYDAHVDKISGFAQANFSYSKFDYYASASVMRTTMWRDSKVRKGLFPDNSKGKSKKLNYTNFGVKAGATYKMDGKNFFSANAGYMTKAPTYRNLYLSPRTRHTSLKDKGQDKDEKIMTFDLGYAYRSQQLKVQASAYVTKFEDQTKTLGFYHDESKTFVNSIQSGVDKLHKGIELGFDYKIIDELSLVGAAAIGKHTIESRPLLTMIADNADTYAKDAADEEIVDRPVYVKGYKETGYPQQAYTLGLKYSSSKYWWAGVNVNHFRDMYLNYSPLRRTVQATDIYNDDAALKRLVTKQHKLDNEFTVDFNIGKSWRIDWKYYINVNLSVNNILDNTDFVTGGYEQSRMKNDGKLSDISQFPPKLYYAYGRNFFLNVSFRF